MTPSINVPTQQPWQQVAQQEFAHLRDRNNTINVGGGKKRRADNSPWGPPQQFGRSPNVNYPAAPSNYQPNQQKPAFSNTLKTHNNLWYCFSCGYDVDHDGYHCPAPRWDHIPDVPRDLAHEVPGACMKAAHKTLPDGTGAGKGWIISQAITKHQYAMPNNANPWQRQPYQQQQRRGWGGRGRGRGGYGRGGGGRNNNQWMQRGGRGWGRN